MHALLVRTFVHAGVCGRVYLHLLVYSFLRVYLMLTTLSDEEEITIVFYLIHFISKTYATL